MGKTSIEWTEYTWNPMTGCDKVSPGCDNCYAETFAERWRGTEGHYFENGFDVQLRPKMLELPLRWTRPRRIFVNSMSDLFHDLIPDDYIARVFAVMALAEQHTFQVLTKRHGRMRSLLRDREFQQQVYEAWGVLETPKNLPTMEDWEWPGWPLPNVWLGVSTENQQWADIRIPALLDTPAAVRWISAEPLLGPIDLHKVKAACTSCHGTGTGWGKVPDGRWMETDCGACEGSGCGLDWVVVGGESGPGARPMQWAWAISLRDQCAAAGVPFLFKQSGSVLAREAGHRGKGGEPDGWPEPFPREYPNV